MPSQTPVDELVRAVQTLPPEAQREVLNFALFLQTRLDAQNAAWDTALEGTTPKQAAHIRARIADQRAQATSLFDSSGKLNPPKPI